MRVDVVGAGLRIILQYENHGVFPKWRLAERFDNPAEGEIVVGHEGARSVKAGASAGGVVAREMHDFELWHVSVADKFIQLGDPRIGAGLFGGLQINSRLSRADQASYLAPVS